ncbi:MAG: SDR family oxidoreductase [Alphaproteobacteria bacterium]|nr:SDR family oxidoreductase [Alphaproteobacteria bacterium]
MTRTGESLLVFGLGYSGRAIALAAQGAGFSVIATSRTPGGTPPPEGVALIDFAAAGSAIGTVTHLLTTAPPEEAGDPVLTRYGEEIAAAGRLRWIGYLSTTGVYGDRAGEWVDEDTPPTPGSARTRRRLAAERDWSAARGACAVDLFRLAGIYGPGRSALDDLRAGTARRIAKPGHAFGRIHRDDIAQAVLAAMRQSPLPGPRILNLADDTPEETARVVEEAARLLGVEPPPAVPFDEAWARMSPIARSFWAESRKVASRKTQAALGIAWRYPSYREGLRAILAEERGEGSA